MYVSLNKTKTWAKNPKQETQNQAISTPKSILESQRETTHVHHRYLQYYLLICTTLLKWLG